jgi:hypothetical protein
MPIFVMQASHHIHFRGQAGFRMSCTMKIEIQRFRQNGIPRTTSESRVRSTIKRSPEVKVLGGVVFRDPAPAR